MRVEGIRYSKRFLKTVRELRARFGMFEVGKYLAGCRVPAAHAMCLLGLPQYPKRAA